MAIASDDGVAVVTVGDLLHDERLSVPRYQRPYSWVPATALQLLDDVHEAFVRTAPSYVLGAVILHRDGERRDIVDGQQRLLTLALVLELLRGTHDGRALAHEDAASPLVVVRTALAQRLRKLQVDAHALADFVERGCWLVRVQTDDEDEAFRVFDSQNYRGKALLPHDLLKAYHLREMSGTESELMQAAVVEQWERVPDADLDRLFSTYLYRVRRWSHGLPAPRFTALDIGLFKGVRPREHLTPMARYHLAAQAAVPVLAAWQSSAGQSPAGDRDALRTRFQLDAPLTAGKPFFEMVTFLLDELRQLRGEYYAQEWQEFASTDQEFGERRGRDRYRYVSELYVAAALYYSNRFGDLERSEARERLFRWAYALRVTQTRVLFRSVDNLASDLQSAFWLIRNASTPLELRQLVPRPLPAAHDRDAGLLRLLSEMETA